MEKYQKELDEFYKKNGWKYWSPLTILAGLFEEGGEFARLVNHLYGEKKKKDTEKKQELEGEMGDIIYTLICFANSNGVDLDRAIRKSFDKMTTRDKDRFTGGCQNAPRLCRGDEWRHLHSDGGAVFLSRKNAPMPPANAPSACRGVGRPAVFTKN